MTAGPVDGTVAPHRRGPRWLRIAVAALLALLVVSLPWSAPALFQKLVFFRVRKVEIRGAVYLTPSEILGRLRVDSSANVWDDASPLVARLMTHPQIRGVTVTRKLPSTLVVRVQENLPVALVPNAKGFAVIDGHGMPLPIDPSATKLDLPIVASRDTIGAGDITRTGPELIARLASPRQA